MKENNRSDSASKVELIDIVFEPIDIRLELKDINLVFDYHLMDKLLAEPLEEIVFNINDL